MHSASASADFDAVALARLLNASFAAWSVTATASPLAGLAAQVRCAGGRTLQVARVDDGGQTLPVWCYGPVDLPVQVAPRAASLAALLSGLRLEIDDDYAPQSLLMGARQSSNSSATHRTASRGAGSIGAQGEGREGGHGEGNGHAEPIVEPIEVHVLTGFLGSGKTTLLNRMIREPALANSAVVVNEFGDVDVDHLLVSHGQGEDEDATLALLGGCLCCELRDGLASTLHDLLARRQRGKCQAFERIIIETTGVADPVPILNLLVTDPLLAELTVIGNVLTVVDALNGPGTLASFAQAVTQVVLADQIVLTKTDVDRYLTAGAMATLKQQLRDMNGDALLHASGVDALPSLSCLLARVPHSPLRLNDSEHARRHCHAANIHTFSLLRETPVPGAALTLFVQALAAHFGADLLRVKGIVRIAESDQQPLLLQGAQRVFHPLSPLDAWPQGHEPRTGLVFIVHSAVNAPVCDSLCVFVEQLFDALIWETTQISARLAQSSSSLTVGEQSKESVSCLI